MSPAKYGQHFLIDETAVDRILSLVDVDESSILLEIGPGQGALTKKLISRPGKVVAVEIDPVLAENLRQRFKSRLNFTVINADFLKFDLASLTNSEIPEVSFKIIGNLPYNITSPILRKLSEWPSWSEGAIMVQKEVGDRLAAEIGTKEYSALTVGMNLTCEMKKEFDLGPEAFQPPPKVNSSVLTIKRRKKALTDDIPFTQRIIQAAFQQRRKTILNSISHGMQIEKDMVSSILKKAGIAETVRPERIEVADFITLAQEVKATI